MNISQNLFSLEGYDYFLPTAFSKLNKVIDPIGNVFLYANLYSRDIGSRISTFPFPVLKCVECLDYYAFNPHTQQCEPCLEQTCIKCANSVEKLCYLCHPDYKIDPTGSCIEKS